MDTDKIKLAANIAIMVLGAVAAGAAVPGAPIPAWIAAMAASLAVAITTWVHGSPPGTKAKIEAAKAEGRASVRPPPS